MKNLASHWNTIYSSKQPTEVSWWQEYPQTSIELIRDLKINKSSDIIDIGGGDSKLIDCLLDDGFTEITVLDISGKALDRAKRRLGERSDMVKWVECDVTDFQPPLKYTLWHDRATFHFLIDESQISKYRSIVGNAVADNGYLILGTFSTNGPNRCSGLPVQQYNPAALRRYFCDSFKEMKSIYIDHVTPSGITQNFLFSCFQKIPLH